MNDFSNLKKKWLQDEDVKRAYDQLGPEFLVVEKLIEKRIEKGMSQAMLAQRAGTKQSAISRFESGTYNPSLQFLKKLADALDAKITVTVS